MAKHWYVIHTQTGYENRVRNLLEGKVKAGLAKDAIAEMNRYSKRVIIASRAGTDGITVTGLFRAGDSISFARAVADTYGLQVRETDGEVRLESR